MCDVRVIWNTHWQNGTTTKSPRKHTAISDYLRCNNLRPLQSVKQSETLDSNMLNGPRVSLTLRNYSVQNRKLLVPYACFARPTEEVEVKTNNKTKLNVNVCCLRVAEHWRRRTSHFFECHSQPISIRFAWIVRISEWFVFATEITFGYRRLYFVHRLITIASVTVCVYAMMMRVQVG